MSGRRVAGSKAPPVRTTRGYLLLCFIPEGADPAVYEDALEGSGEGQPEVEGGPPHAELGMVHGPRVHREALTDVRAVSGDR